MSPAELAVLENATLLELTTLELTVGADVLIYTELDETGADDWLEIASLEDERFPLMILPPSQAATPAISELNIKVRRALRLLARKPCCNMFWSLQKVKSCVSYASDSHSWPKAQVAAFSS